MAVSCAFAQREYHSRFPQRLDVVHLYKLFILFHCPLDGLQFTIPCRFLLYRFELKDAIGVKWTTALDIHREFPNNPP